MPNNLEFYKSKLNDTLTNLEEVSKGMAIYAKQAREKSLRLVNDAEEYERLIEEETPEEPELPNEE